MYLKRIGYILLIILALRNCEQINHPPEIISMDPLQSIIRLNDSLLVHCNAEDPDGDALSFSWEARYGNVIGNGEEVIWVSPDTVGTFTIVCTVQDPDQNSDSDSIEVTVRALNLAPVIDSLMVEADMVIKNESIQVICLAHDPDGSELSYYWSCSGGEISGSDSVAIWTTPPNYGEFSITCEVRDIDDAIDLKVHTIFVSDHWVRYVSPNGDNTNSGRSWGSAYQSITFALGTSAELEGVETNLVLDTGTFSPSKTGESFPINIGDDTHIVGQGVEQTILNGEGNTIIESDQSWYGNVLISDLSLTGGNIGVEVGFDSNVDLKNLKIYNNSGSGAKVMYGLLNIESSEIHNNGGHGLTSSQDGRIRASQCIIHNNAFDGIQVGYDGRGTVKNSVIYLNGRNGVSNTYFGTFSGTNLVISENQHGLRAYEATNNYVSNSIFWDNTTGSIDLFDLWRNNLTLSYSNVQGGEEAITGANFENELSIVGGLLDTIPMFIDQNYRNYHLEESSPCVDAGNPATSFFDVDGSRNDIGAFGGPGGDW